jgi:mannosyltransferase OCH1-like enzyme
MIPKKIHYCWLSGEKFPEAVEKTMNTWKEIMPDYEFILWDSKRFDINSIASVKDAYDSKKWAFAADYIRFYAIYTEGGIYLDTDVIVKKSFDDFLNYGFFSGIDSHYGLLTQDYHKVLKYRTPINKIIPNIAWAGVNAAIFGAEKGNQFIKDLLDWYNDNQYEIKPSQLDTEKTLFEYIAPEIFATIAENYGFDRTKNQKQYLPGNMVIFPTSVFGADITQSTENSYAVHCTNSGWKAKKKWYNNKYIRRLLGIKTYEKPKFDFFDMFQKFEQFNFPK